MLQIDWNGDKKKKTTSATIHGQRCADAHLLYFQTTSLTLSQRCIEMTITPVAHISVAPEINETTRWKSTGREDVCCNADGDLNQFEARKPENVDYYVHASYSSSYVLED